MCGRSTATGSSARGRDSWKGSAGFGFRVPGSARFEVPGFPVLGFRGSGFWVLGSGFGGSGVRGSKELVDLGSATWGHRSETGPSFAHATAHRSRRRTAVARMRVTVAGHPGVPNVAVKSRADPFCVDRHHTPSGPGAPSRTGSPDRPERPDERRPAGRRRYRTAQARRGTTHPTAGPPCARESSAADWPTGRS
jgi:hypothetical protein